MVIALIAIVTLASVVTCDSVCVQGQTEAC